MTPKIFPTARPEMTATISLLDLHLTAHSPSWTFLMPTVSKGSAHTVIIWTTSIYISNFSSSYDIFDVRTINMSSIQRREHWFLMLNRTHHFCISIMTELTKYQDRKWGDSKAQLAYDLKLQYCQQGQVAMGILWYLFWTLSKRINTEWVTKFIIRVLIQFVTLSMKFVLAKYN